MFELMQSVMLIFIEIMCCKIFYETFGEVRYKGWINTIQFILLLRNCREIICIFLESMLIYVMNEFSDSGGHFHGT